jgi:hypothetical protein
LHAGGAVGCNSSTARWARRGDCFATLENDLPRRRSFATRQDARTAVFDYTKTFYDPVKPDSTFGYRLPVEYEEVNEEAQAA